MDRNVGETDRLVRIAVGALLIATGTILALAVEFTVPGMLAAVVGIATLVSGITCRCGIYQLIGMNSVDRAEGR